MPKKAGFHLGQSTKILTQARVQELLSYDPETGVFTWRISLSNRAPVGSVAGTNSYGYVHIGVDGTIYRAHRLAWLWVHGALPTTDVDHINCNRADNRISNLRLASRSQNCANIPRLRATNSSGRRGVCWDKSRGKWAAQITINYRNRLIGRFDNIDDAEAAYLKVAREHFGAFHSDVG